MISVKREDRHRLPRPAKTAVLFCLSMVGIVRVGMAQSAQETVATMLQHESQEAGHREHYLYLSREKSDRTGGHLWEEKVAETTAGKIRMLVSEDGQVLSTARQEVERSRLADIVAHPDAFAKKEAAAKSDEAHAQQLLSLLPRAFVFENARSEGAYTRIDFRPNPDYSPQSLEERVLHAMVGSMLVDSKQMRLHELSGHLPEDVSIGFGFVATIHAGSNFSTKRDRLPGGEWKTNLIETNINGRAIFFKSVGKKEHSEHTDFRKLPFDLTLAQAAENVERETGTCCGVRAREKRGGK